MIQHLISLSLRHRVMMIVIALALCAVGFHSALRLPMDALPDITSLQMEVNTPVEALAPEEVEKQITVPLERELAGLPGLSLMRSTSKYGLSQISLTFNDTAPPVYELRQLVSERLQGGAGLIPPGLQPVIPQVSSGLGEIYYYQVRYRSKAPDKPADPVQQLIQLKILQDYTIAPWFMEVPGVAEVSTSGGFVDQVVIEPDPVHLAASGLTFDDISTVVKQNVSNSGGGVVQKAGQQVLVRTISRVNSPKEIESLALRYGAGIHPILIRDVASVKMIPRPRNGAALVNGEEAVIGAVVMLRGSNTREVAQNVRAKLAEIQGKLPTGIELFPLYDRGELISHTVGTIEHNLLTGALLVVTVLFFFLGNWRAALIVALSIPLSLFFALTGMTWIGLTGNLISLGAIDFGLIVDGSVVMAENILRHLVLRQSELGRTLRPEERIKCVEEACFEVGPSMVAGVAIITLVYVPIMSLTGIEGKMFEPLAVTVTLALIGALLLALTLVPALCSLLLTGHLQEKEAAWLHGLKTTYYRLLEMLLPRWKTLSAVGLGCCTGAGLLFTFLGAEFLPRLDEGTTLLAIYRTDSIGLDSALDFERSTHKLIREKYPQVQTVFSRVGADDKSVDPVGSNQSDAYLLYGAKAPADKEELESKMADDFKVIVPGQLTEFVQPIEDRFNDFFEASRADVAVKISGDDFIELEKLGHRVEEILHKIPGSADVAFNAFQRTPVENISPNREALAKYGLQADDINRSLALALAGEKAGTLLTNDRSTDIVLRYPDHLRTQAEHLSEFPVRLADGGMITLDQVATVQTDDQVDQIDRERGRRTASVLSYVHGRDVQSFVAELRQKIAQEVKLPSGYTIDYAGQFKNLESASQRLLIIVPGALALIFALVYMAFRDWKQVLLIYTGIPLAATGGVVALFLRQIPFSIPAAIGFIALSGVAVLNGIVLISYFNKLVQAGKTIKEAVLEGAQIRLRPVLMTALVASLGLIPMAIATGPGAEVQRPLATVVIGGILTSTFLTLFLLPALYNRFVHTQCQSKLNLCTSNSSTSSPGPLSLSPAPSWQPDSLPAHQSN